MSTLPPKIVVTVFENTQYSLVHISPTRYGDAGYWLYDKMAGMNLSMRAKTEQEAYSEAIDYYHNRMLQLQTEVKNLSNPLAALVETLKLTGFIEPFNSEDDDNFLNSYR